MKVLVKGTNVKITPEVKAHAEQRLGKLTRYFSRFDEAKVTCRHERKTVLADITLQVGGLTFRSEEKAGDLKQAIDDAAAKLERQLKRFREKINHRLRKENSSLTAALDEQLAERIEAAIAVATHDDHAIVRRKRFAMKPMAPEEAILQMELLHHDFFVFINTETEDVAVLYRREDGGFGLIERGEA